MRMFVCNECDQFHQKTTHSPAWHVCSDNMFCYGRKECNYNVCKDCALKPRRRSGDEMDLQKRRDIARGRDPNDPNRYGTPAASSSSTKRKQEQMIAEEESKMPPCIIDSEEEAILPRSEFDEINPSDSNLEEFSNAKRRSHNGYYDVDEGAPKHYYVKKETKSSWVQPTRWNEGCMKTTFCMKTTLMRTEPGSWRKVEDRYPVETWQECQGLCGSDKVDLIVIIHGEALKMPEGSTRPNNPSVRAESRRTMTAAQKRSQAENVAMICVQDDTFHALTASIDEIEATKVSLKEGIRV